MPDDRFRTFDIDTNVELMETFGALDRDDYGRPVIDNPATLAHAIQERFILIPKDQIPELEQRNVGMNASHEWHQETVALADAEDWRSHGMRKVLISLARIAHGDKTGEHNPYR